MSKDCGIARLRVSPYLRNLAILKQYGNRMKLVRCNCVRNKGVGLLPGEYVSKGSVNDKKLLSNIYRARSAVREFVLCNPFNLFVTLTIDSKKYDRYDLKKFHSDLAQWIRNYNKKHGLHVKYVLIPEQHKDGAWHEHGFLMGLPLSLLKPFTLDEHLPEYIRDKLANGETVYNWPDYAAKFGFVDIEPLYSRERAASYVTKYITKDMSRSVSEIGAHLYYASKGLERSTVVKRGTMIEDVPADYEGEYCKINWYDLSEYDAEQIKGLIISDYEKEKMIHDTSSRYP